MQPFVSSFANFFDFILLLLALALGSVDLIADVGVLLVVVVLFDWVDKKNGGRKKLEG